jgi:hypothetical protein
MEWTNFLKGALNERNNKWGYLPNT